MCIYNYIIQLQLINDKLNMRLLDIIKSIAFVFGGNFILVGLSFKSKANLLTLWIKFDPTFSSIPNLGLFFVHPL